MKKSLKILLWALVIFVAVTLSQATTMSVVFQQDKAFLKIIFRSKKFVKAWLNDPLFWKYSIVLLALAVSIAVSICTFVSRSLKKLFKPKTKRARSKKTATVTQPVQVKETDLKTVHATIKQGGNQGRFKRVPPKK